MMKSGLGGPDDNLSRKMRMEVTADNGLVTMLGLFVRAYAAWGGFSPSQAKLVELAFEEAFVNVVKHAHGDPRGNLVVLDFCFEEDTFSIRIEDGGRLFNPLEHPDLDIKKYLASEKTGGLGVHMMKKIMDRLEYSVSAQGGNILTMFKKVC